MGNTKGQVVKVYEDPITEQILEGEAKLLELLWIGRPLEYWRVRFKDDFETRRFIKGPRKEG